MKVDLNFDLSGLDGKSIPNANVGKIIANSLVSQSKGDALKFWEWALALNKGESLELDLSDFETFTSFIKENDNLPILTKAQIITALKK